MKPTCFLLLVLCSLFSFTSCSDKKSNDPEPEAKKTFTGCRLIKMVNPTTNSLTEYFYDSNNNIIKVTNGNTTGGIGTYTHYKYDVNGRIITGRYYLNVGSNDTTSILSVYQYNSAGRLISEKKYGRPNYTTPFEEYRYFYDASGKVDSSWSDGGINGILKPQWLFTYEYDNRGNLAKQHHISVNSNNGLTFTPGGTEEYLNYDNYKTPQGQEYFTLRQLSPPSLFTKNSPAIMVSTNGQQRSLTYVYRPDSLVAEMTYGGLNYTTQFVYDCN